MTATGPPALPGPPSAADARLPAPEELRTWRRYLLANARITRILEAELVAAQDLSLAAYDVLVQLSEAPGRTLRMTELAQAVLLSRSGVTRLVERLELAHLVRRVPAPGDGRGVQALLTNVGQTRLEAAARVHLAGVFAHFVLPLGASGLAHLDAALATLLDRKQQTE